MAIGTRKYVASKYKFVKGEFNGKDTTWRVYFRGGLNKSCGKGDEGEKLAAKKADLELIRQGLEPVNILKRVKNGD